VPRIRPLTPSQAKRTLTQRLAPVVDRVRQLNTELGQRSRRVFLVWTKWTGGGQGDGDEVEVDRLELLPTPKVSGLDAVPLAAMSAGVLPVGSIRVSEVSVSLTEGQLRGLYAPAAGISAVQPDGTTGPTDHVPPGFGFFYEVVEDGRGDAFPVREKYRLSSQPRMNEANIGWELVLERISEDASRDGSSTYGDGA
jgi:hypothetical protein